MLDKTRLKGKIRAAFEYEQNEEENANDSLDRIADKLATAIIDEIKELKINYTTGLVAPSTGGTVTGNLNSVTIS
jgi:hypothetical protein